MTRPYPYMTHYPPSRTTPPRPPTPASPAPAQQTSARPPGPAGQSCQPGTPHAARPASPAARPSGAGPAGPGRTTGQNGPAAPSRPASSPSTPQAAGQDVVLPSSTLGVPDILAWHSIPQDLINAMAGSSLAAGLERVIDFSPLPLRPGVPRALGGASGSGKSLTLAKLAARYARQAQQSGGRLRQPLVMACDSTPGSYIKLASILRGCDIELIKAYGGLSPELIDGHDRIILVDLPGLCVYSPSAMAEMQEVVARTKATLSLVIPAGMDPEESTDIAAAFLQCRADSLIASRMEQSGRIGSIITAAACGLSLTYGSYSGNINEGFTQLTPAILARRLLVLPR